MWADMKDIRREMRLFITVPLCFNWQTCGCFPFWLSWESVRVRTRCAFLRCMAVWNREGRYHEEWEFGGRSRSIHTYTHTPRQVHIRKAPTYLNLPWACVSFTVREGRGRRTGRVRKGKTKTHTRGISFPFLRPCRLVASLKAKPTRPRRSPRRWNISKSAHPSELHKSINPTLTLTATGRATPHMLDHRPTYLGPYLR
ncbi:hypothetical protein LY78DRAFT_210554 [Colletotrichum sublineola]|nr:hypothetical protein LY78DRAFT_210554 [Colletotrichum sublineola]